MGKNRADIRANFILINAENGQSIKVNSLIKMQQMESMVSKKIAVSIALNVDSKALVEQSEHSVPKLLDKVSTVGFKYKDRITGGSLLISDDTTEEMIIG